MSPQDIHQSKQMVPLLICFFEIWQLGPDAVHMLSNVAWSWIIASCNTLDKPSHLQEVHSMSETGQDENRNICGWWNVTLTNPTLNFYSWEWYNGQHICLRNHQHYLPDIKLNVLYPAQWCNDIRWQIIQWLHVSLSHITKFTVSSSLTVSSFLKIDNLPLSHKTITCSRSPNQPCS